MVTGHLAYLAISVTTTIWVARTLQRNGRIFLRDLVLGQEELADAVNNLLVVGFYLINIGYVALALQYGDRSDDPTRCIEIVSSKVGVVLLVLGCMHFLNLYIFSRLRKRALIERVAPPVHPSEYLVHGVKQPERALVR